MSSTPVPAPTLGYTTQGQPWSQSYPKWVPNGSASPDPTNVDAASVASGQTSVTAVAQDVKNDLSQSLTQQSTTAISTSIQTAITAEVRTAMTHVLSNVPWIKFRVHAEPDLQVFQTDVQLQQALTQISSVAATTIAQTIITEFTSQIQTLLQSVTKTASSQISTTMIQLIQELITVSTLTHFSTNAAPLIIAGIPECPAEVTDPVVIVEPEPPKPPADYNPTPDLATTSWIWTSEVSDTGIAPVGVRPFRKTFVTPFPVDRLCIDMTTDNYYTLYVEGLLVGSARDWRKGERYKIAFPETTVVTIAVYAGNEMGPAGIIAAGVAWNSKSPHPRGFSVFTDADWKTLTTPDFPRDFISPDFDDENWPNAVVEGAYGTGVWGDIEKPTEYESQNGALTSLPDGVPDAPTVPPADVLVS